MSRHFCHYTQPLLFLFFLLSAAPTLAGLEECPDVVPGNTPKKIAIFTDGTGNTPSDQTNVRRLYELIQTQPDRSDIVAYYDRGVGTYHNVLLGQAVGLGFSLNVLEAYTCLAEHYRPGDQIYLFGFSRGAYTARVLGGLVDLMGIVEFPQDSSSMNKLIILGKLYKVYRDNLKPGFEQKRAEFRSKHTTHDADIDVMGVWDTVSALGVTATEDKLREACINSPFLALLERQFDSEDGCLLSSASERLYQRYHRVGPEGIKKILHAVSIDEKRNAFEIHLYDPADIAPSQKFKQIWFAGVHSDVGGGYEDSSDLAAISLNWMIANLKDDDLLSEAIQVRSNSRGKLHTSYKSFYKLAEPRVRRITQGSAIHHTAIERMQIDRLPEPNENREPEGRYRPVQFQTCIDGQPDIAQAMAACYQVVSH